MSAHRHGPRVRFGDGEIVMVVESMPCWVLIDTPSFLACGPSPDTAIVSGVNLAMLLGFVTWRESGDFEELVAKIVQKGREAIVLVGGR